MRNEIAPLVGCAAVDIDERQPLAQYGLTSLQGTGLMARLSEALGRPLPVTDLWAYPTVHALASHVLAGPGSAAGGDVGAEGGNPGTPREPVAVVGLACRFPGGTDADSFWRLLETGTDAVRPVPADRWNADALVSPQPDAPRKMITSQGGFLSDPIDAFDPLFFGISPREAREMDPQQRLFLEVAWEALEDAGLSAEGLAGSDTGVFAGVISHDFADVSVLKGQPESLSSHSATGRALNLVANRLSYVLGLSGPSMAVDSACSSSLLAVHLACQSLWTGESSIAIAGGVNLILSSEMMVALTKFGGLSPDGRCKAFDAAADGFGRGEGCGVVVLKPLSRALADGDDIWCVIRGSAANNDGSSNGLTAPNPIAQERMLRAAYRRAGVAPHDVHYVETHGTGTSLGDPIEAHSLGAVLSAGRPADESLVIGSVKTNIAHLEAAAGIAGFIKTAMMLRKGMVPPSLHFREPNPHIAFDELNLRVATGIEPWPADRPLLAGVSAFGWGGTNVHAVLEGWREPADLALAGQVPAAPARGGTRPPRIAFVCSPYGQQWVGMGRLMYRTEPVFRSVVERCDAELVKHTGWSLVEELFRDEGTRFDEAAVVQPVMFALQLGIAAWLEDRGIRPDAVTGHSIGEFAAFVIGGILDLPDAVRLVHHYSVQTHRAAGQGGGMALVALSADELGAYLPDGDDAVHVTAQNGPRATVISGAKSELTALVARLKADGVQAGLVRVDIAGHSPAIDPITDDLVRVCQGVTARPGRIPVVSTVTGRLLDWREVGPEYVARNARRPVQFVDAIASLLDDGCQILIEIGANPVLGDALRQNVDASGTNATVLATMRPGEDDRLGLLDTLAACARLGADVRLPDPATAGRDELFTLSAKTPQALRELAERVAHTVDHATGPVALPDVVAAGIRRSTHPYRLAAVTDSPGALAAALCAYAHGDAPAEVLDWPRAAETRPKVAFVFPGQGSQWIGMGRELLRTEPVFQATIRACDEVARSFVDYSITEELRADDEDAHLDRIDVVQPVLFAIEVGLAALWRSWGIEPDAVVGHSMGETAAAHVAGLLGLEDALRIICLRSRLMRRLSGAGAMLAVELTLDEAQEAISGHEDAVSIAVNNSPRSTVLSGDRDVLATIEADLSGRDVFCRWVKVDVASHSPQMDVLRPELLTALHGLAPRPGTVPMYSTVTGEVMDHEELTEPYWVENLRRPVLFAAQVSRLVQEGFTAFIEMSPHPILLPAIDQVAAGHPGAELAALASLRKNEPVRTTLLRSVGALYLRGGPVDLERVGTPGRRRLKLPSYPWQRERFPLDLRHTNDGLGGTRPAAEAGAPLLGERFDSPVEPGTHYWQADYHAGTVAVGDHRIGGSGILPAAAYTELALSAASEVLTGGDHTLSQMVFLQPLTVPEQGSRRVQTMVQVTDEDTARLRVFAHGDAGPVCTAEATLGREETTPPEPLDLAGVRRRMAEELAGPAFYRLLASRGLGYGSAYQCVAHVARAGDEALARIEVPDAVLDNLPGHLVHPSLLDAAFQATLAPLLGPDWGTRHSDAYLNGGIGRVRLHGRHGPSAWAHAVCRETGDPRVREADVRVAGPDGTVLVEVTGLRLVRADDLPRDAAPAPARSGVLDAAGADTAPIRDLVMDLASGEERRSALEKAVQEQVAKVVRLPAHRIPLDRPLRGLGIDSLMSVELRNRLERVFGIPLSATLIWNHPTINDIAPFLAGKAGIPLEDDSGPSPDDRPVGRSGRAQASATPPAAASVEELLARELAEIDRKLEAF
ncbi:acyltransferase domain-containing protein [Streptomyces olivaceoviridis]|uniref:acyltransferase domain-containing protein n=1 Tax=Streptomyces olivaceoviridis TaxID=1921 RepID=UPI0036FBB837